MKIVIPNYPGPFGFTTEKGSMVIYHASCFATANGGTETLPIGDIFAAAFTDDKRRGTRSIQLTDLSPPSTILEKHSEGIILCEDIECDPTFAEIIDGLKKAKGAKIVD